VVTGVRYPGLASHPQHALAARQMRRFGGVISFELADAAAVARFFAATQLVREATSFGGVHTSAERRARWGGDAVSEGFVRLSVGVESVEDLRRDLGRGLDAV
jgi:cystathionine gamma-lyase